MHRVLAWLLQRFKILNTKAIWKLFYNFNMIINYSTKHINHVEQGLSVNKHIAVKLSKCRKIKANDIPYLWPTIVNNSPNIWLVDPHSKSYSSNNYLNLLKKNMLMCLITSEKNRKILKLLTFMFYLTKKSINIIAEANM